MAGVSIAMNFMALPIYNVADRIQEKQRKIAKSLEERVRRIKKAFKGDEQFMMLQTYYRENNYHPLYVLRSSLSILIELPFFIAAYHYLSHCEALRGASFWIFRDLGEPDRMFTVSLGARLLAINVLPIIMTLINFVSGAIYTKDAPAREKIQLYAVAVIFLALLYNSPSGLVIYWILNNLFSLVKNIAMKMPLNLKRKHLGFLAYALMSIAFVTGTLFYVINKPNADLWKKVFLLCFTMIVIAAPFAVMAAKRRFPELAKMMEATPEENKRLFPIFLSSCIALVLLTGFLLPASLVASSPAEFSFLGNTDSPLSYIWSTFFLITGLFLFWPLVVYKMFGPEVKYYETVLFFALFVCTILNAYVFKADYGTIDPLFNTHTNLLAVPKSYFILPLVIFALAAALPVLADKSKGIHSVLSVALVSLCAAEVSLGAYKTYYIKNEFTRVAKLHKMKQLASEDEILKPIYNFSKTEKNVLVIFLDRAISSFFPYIVRQFPEMEEQFSGFTYYPNTLSFGRHTVFGFPPLIGGYEYTQVEMNRRSDKLLKDKHNEALLVLPKIFADAGYDVTYTDPSAPNYEWSGDLSAFAPYPEIKVSEHRGDFSRLYEKEMNIDMETKIDETCRKQMPYFCIMEGMHPLFRKKFNSIVANTLSDYNGFIHDFSSLYYLKDVTVFNNEKPTFTFIENETPHNPISLNAPDYDTPAPYHGINSTYPYPAINSTDVMDYHVNAAALKQVANYFDYLKENGVYDNTRIIVVADHGFRHEYSAFENFKDRTLPASFNPLFMVKDFYATGKLSTDNTFMTNADTLFLAKEGLGLSDTNPFTGKKFTQEKDSVTVWMMYNDEYNVTNIKHKNQFTLKQGYTIRENLFDPDDWEPVQYKQYLKNQETK